VETFGTLLRLDGFIPLSQSVTEQLEAVDCFAEAIGVDGDTLVMKVFGESSSSFCFLDSGIPCSSLDGGTLLFNE